MAGLFEAIGRTGGGTFNRRAAGDPSVGPRRGGYTPPTAAQSAAYRASQLQRNPTYAATIARDAARTASPEGQAHIARNAAARLADQQRSNEMFEANRDPNRTAWYQQLHDKGGAAGGAQTWEQFLHGRGIDPEQYRAQNPWSGDAYGFRGASYQTSPATPYRTHPNVPTGWSPENGGGYVYGNRSTGTPQAPISGNSTPEERANIWNPRGGDTTPDSDMQQWQSNLPGQGMAPQGQGGIAEALRGVSQQGGQQYDNGPQTQMLPQGMEGIGSLLRFLMGRKGYGFGGGGYGNNRGGQWQQYQTPGLIA